MSAQRQALAVVPVMHRLTARQHLVAACHHNLGSVDIVPYSCHDAEVSATAMVCCCFVMYRDEASSPEAWTRLVRAVVEAFRSSGLEQPFTSPWGRSYHAAGKPTAPEVAFFSWYRPRFLRPCYTTL